MSWCAHEPCARRVITVPLDGSGRSVRGLDQGGGGGGGGGGDGGGESSVRRSGIGAKVALASDGVRRL